jgi:molecular chaperone DnaK
MSEIVGIDLGTTNSVVAWTDQNGRTEIIAGPEGSRIVPSVVYFDPEGGIIVGERATQFSVIEPTRAARLFKRGMGLNSFLNNGEKFTVDGKTWSPEELSSLVLKKLVTHASSHLRQEIKRVVITVCKSDAVKIKVLPSNSTKTFSKIGMIGFEATTPLMADNCFNKILEATRNFIII